MKTAIHITAAHQRQFLGYAMMCVHSLIRKGAFKPEDIHVLVAEEFDPKTSDAIAVMKRMGAQIHTQRQHAMLGKFCQLDAFFEERPDYHQVLKLDADTMLTEDCNFLHHLWELGDRANFALYRQLNVNPVDTQLKRMSMFHLAGMEYASEWGQKRVNSLIAGLFGVDYQTYVEWLGLQEAWWYGGFLLVNQIMTEKPVWNAMVALNAFTPCDETCIALAQYNNLVGNRMYHTVHQISQARFPHVVNPTNFVERVSNIDHTSSPGILHYAGNWFRKDHIANSQVLAERAARIIKEVLK